MDKKGTLVVTGASSGIGKTCAQVFAAEGWRVVVTARRKEVLEENFGGSPDYVILPWDLSDLDSIKDYAKAVLETAGPIKGLVHCAGMGIGNAVNMIKPAVLQQLFSINVYAAMLLVSAFSKKKMIDEKAAFVLISSIAAHAGTQGQSIYAATKGALEGFICGSAAELADKGIRINAIAPGLVETEMVKAHNAKLDPETVEKLNAGYPLGTGSPENVADMAAFLIEKGVWITGQTYVMDGGFMVRKP